MWANKKTHIHIDQAHMEYNVPKGIQASKIYHYKEAKSIIMKDAPIKFYTKNDQLYLETDVSCVRLGGPCKVRGRMQFPENEAPDNSALKPTAFQANLTGAKAPYRNTEREALSILCGLEKFYNYCFKLWV